MLVQALLGQRSATLVTALMPLRYTESLTYLKRHYDGLLTDHNESYLLHGEGNGKKLPPLFARTANETMARGMRKPTLLVTDKDESVSEITGTPPN